MRELRPLPVPVTSHASESGLGFLLRLARQNGLSLTALLHWVGIRSLLDIPPEGVRALAYVADVSPTWLAFRLARRRKVDGRLQRAWMGHAWTSTWSLRTGHPQVCAACLREDGVCASFWEVTGLFLCPRHGQLLLDHCGHCNQRLTWSRPAADVCGCGRYLSGPARDEAWPSVVIQWLEAVQVRLEGAMPRMPLSSDWPPWVFSLSAEGMTTLVHALGVINRPYEPVRSDVSRSLPSSAWMADVIQRGLGRLACLKVIDRDAADRLQGLVYEQALERLARHGAIQADRDIAEHLVQGLCRTPKSGLSLTGRRSRRQLDLFGEIA